MFFSLSQTSDYRHNVITPTLLLSSYTLFHTPLSSPLIITRALFLSSLLYDYVAHGNSKRYLPENIAFLHATLIRAFQLDNEKIYADKKQIYTKKIKNKKFEKNGLIELDSKLRVTNFDENLVFLNLNAFLSSSKTEENLCLPFSCIFDENTSAVAYFSTDEFSHAFFYTLLTLIRMYASLYQHIPSYIESFDGIYSCLLFLYHTQCVSNSTLNAYLYESIELLASYRMHTLSTRKPLVHNIIPTSTQIMKGQTPRYEEEFQPGIIIHEQQTYSSDTCACILIFFFIFFCFVF